MRNIILAITVSLLTCIQSAGQEARSFPLTVPAGNYSGIAWTGDSTYVVVDDKSPTDGFYTFYINIDSITGTITSVRRGDFHASTLASRDGEGIVWNPHTQRIWMGGETDNEIREYHIDGSLTGRRLPLSERMRKCAPNYGYESLGYNPVTRRYWTMTESTLPMDGNVATSTNGVSNRLRLQAFDDSLHAVGQWAYLMDAPHARHEASNYAMGVSEVCALDDGRVIVLEREFYVPKIKLGAFVRCKLYVVDPEADAEARVEEDKPLADGQHWLQKTLLRDWTTRLTLFGRNIANYEGMCLGPTLADGRRVLVLVSDSQAQYAGVLRDWFMTIVMDK